MGKRKSTLVDLLSLISLLVLLLFDPFKFLMYGPFIVTVDNSRFFVFTAAAAAGAVVAVAVVVVVVIVPPFIEATRNAKYMKNSYDEMRNDIRKDLYKMTNERNI